MIMKCKNCNNPGCPHRTTDGEKECVYSQVLGHDPLSFEQMKELQQMQLQHDWEALRNQAAIAAMQGLIVADSEFNFGTKSLVNMAIQHANELVKQLKGKKL